MNILIIVLTIWSFIGIVTYHIYVDEKVKSESNFLGIVIFIAIVPFVLFNEIILKKL